MEKWLPIKDYSNYLVSDKGNYLGYKFIGYEKEDL